MRREQKYSTSKLVLSIGKSMSTPPEQQAGACTHGTAWTALGPNTKAQGPFSGEDEGTVTPQRGRKGLGLTHWKKDGCWHRVQADAGWRGRQRVG